MDKDVLSYCGSLHSWEFQKYENEFQLDVVAFTSSIAKEQRHWFLATNSATLRCDLMSNRVYLKSSIHQDSE